MAKELARELINAGVHFGHNASRWNPKMAPYIFAKRGKIHVINVKETLKGVLIAKRLLAEIVASGKDVVFVGTKRQAQKSVEAVAEKCGMHYVSQRWLGGMLTNFRTVRSRLQRLEQLEGMAANGTLESESKKQASRLKREMRKIKSNLEGVRKMSRLPGVVVVVDARKEYLALAEAKKLGISTVALIDTNSDPDSVTVAIPANDDSIRAISLILNELGDAVAIGKTMVSARQEVSPQPKQVRSKRQAMGMAAGGKKTEPASASVAAEAKPAEPVKEDGAAEGEAKLAEPAKEATAANEPAVAEESKQEDEQEKGSED